MNRKRMWLFVIIVILCSIFTVRAEDGEENAESLYAQWQETFLEELKLDDIQEILDGELGDHHFSIMETLKSVMKGEIPFSKEVVQKFLYNLFFLRINKERELIMKVTLDRKSVV